MFNHIYRSYSTLIMLCASVFVAQACKKPATNSSVKTLDNFAGGSEVHLCSGNYKNNKPYMEYVLGGTNESRAAAETSLSALPAELKDRIFFGAKVSIKFVKQSELPTACLGSVVAKAYANQAQHPLLACHRAMGGEFVILVSDNANDVRRGLVRALSYYLTEIDSKLAQVDGKTVLKPYESASLMLQKDVLTLAFLSDIKASSKFKLDVFKGLIHPSVLSAETDAKRSEIWFNLSGSDAIARRLFSNYVLAEAFDSYYCSESSRNAVLTNFPKTAGVLGLSQKAPMASSGQSQKASFGLGGGGLFGGGLLGRLFGVGGYSDDDYADTSSTPSAGVTPPSVMPPATGIVSQGTDVPNPQPQNRKPAFQLPTDSLSYYNPSSYSPMSQADVDSLGKAYSGQNDFVKSAGLLTFDPKQGAYTGYSNGGSWKKQPSGEFAWLDSVGKPTGQTTKLDDATGKWVNGGAVNDMYYTPTKKAEIINDSVKLNTTVTDLPKLDPKPSTVDYDNPVPSSTSISKQPAEPVGGKYPPPTSTSSVPAGDVDGSSTGIMTSPEDAIQY